MPALLSAIRPVRNPRPAARAPRPYGAALALAALLATAIATATSSAANAPSSQDRHFVQDVPFTSQLPNYCGPASLSSLLAHYGVAASQESIGAACYDSRAQGTNGADLLLYCMKSGLAAYSFNADLPRLKKMIAMDYPVLVLQDRARSWKEGHFRVAVGFDDAKGTITLRDSTQPEYVVLSYDEFDRLWERRGRWALLVTPKERDRFASTLGGPNAVLHMDLAQAYIREGQGERAEAECRKALALEPDNPHVEALMRKAKALAKGTKPDAGAERRG